MVLGNRMTTSPTDMDSKHAHWSRMHRDQGASADAIISLRGRWPQWLVGSGVVCEQVNRPCRVCSSYPYPPTFRLRPALNSRSRLEASLMPGIGLIFAQ